MKKLLTKNLSCEVEEFAKSALKRKRDVQVLIDESIINGFESEFEELAFTAKYIEGLKRVLQKGSEFQEIENLDYVKKDLTKNMEEIIEQFKIILNKSSLETREYFNETYFNLTPQCFENLNELLSDLEWIKKYLNFKKHSV
jgi:hypothetical protein